MQEQVLDAVQPSMQRASKPAIKADVLNSLEDVVTDFIKETSDVRGALCMADRTSLIVNDM